MPQEMPRGMSGSTQHDKILSQQKSEFFKMNFKISRPQKIIKAQPGGEAASSPACAIGAFIGLHGQKCI